MFCDLLWSQYNESVFQDSNDTTFFDLNLISEEKMCVQFNRASASLLSHTMSMVEYFAEFFHSCLVNKFLSIHGIGIYAGLQQTMDNDIFV